MAEHWTLSSKEPDLIGDSKTDHNLLGFAVLLKYFQHEGRFPTHKQDISPLILVHLAQQLGVVPEKIIPYDWEGRTIKAHRAAIRTFLGFHEATSQDEEAIVEWLCQHELAEQRQEEALIASVYAHCKESRIEPPTPAALAASCIPRSIDLMSGSAPPLRSDSPWRLERTWMRFSPW